MKYTNFKDNKVSLLGMGCMRLPLGADDKVDEAEAIRVIRHGIDSGITYIDTAYMYHNGFSERVIGKALKDGYREKVLLADKMPPWLAPNKLSFVPALNGSALSSFFSRTMPSDAI